ncbi:hypothetical protein GIB67_039350 [Kingdonia uniflora]|uniref:Uncharacterized protein n=1 Tax=Kingdonia uniflora TaxID=39325 RepID=A0A7J7LXG5_9MAGN|nr:hypothetical protein GIB67_039350 [Kingdonia uniflora]
MNIRKKQKIRELFGYNEGQLPEKYLGISLIKGRVQKVTVMPLVEAIIKRASTWAGSLLSMQGKVIQIQYVLSSIFVYNMGIYKWPISVIQEGERYIINFLWSGSSDTMKAYTVSWEKVCKPRSEGGLGIRILKDINLSLLMKLARKFLDGDDDKAKFMRAKFTARNGDLCTYSTGSSVWSSLKWVMPMVKQNFGWIVGDEEDIDIWRDNWCASVFTKELVNNNARLNIDLGMIKIYRGKRDQKIWEPDLLGKLSTQFAHKTSPDIKAMIKAADNKSSYIMDLWISSILGGTKTIRFARNRKIHDNDCIDMEKEKRNWLTHIQDVAFTSTGCMHNIQEDLSIVHVLRVPGGPRKETLMKSCFWELPSMGEVKNNTDGASKGKPGKGGWVILLETGVKDSASNGWLIAWVEADPAVAVIAFQSRAIPWSLQGEWHESNLAKKKGMEASPVLEALTSGCSAESESVVSDREDGIEVFQFPDFPGKLVSYPPNSDMFRKFYITKALLGGRWGNFTEYAVGRMWNANMIWVNGDCLQRDDGEPMELLCRTVKQSSTSKVMWKKSQLDNIAQEGVELEAMLKVLSISRKKRANSRSEKVQKSQATRLMTGVGGNKKKGGDRER